jgi:hypothetical protein
MHRVVQGLRNSHLTLHPARQLEEPANLLTHEPSLIFTTSAPQPYGGAAYQAAGATSI